MHINIDDLPHHKSASSQFWPILGTFDGVNIFIICLLLAPLNGFIKEMETLTYFQHQGKNIKVNLRCFTCDAPVRSFLRHTINQGPGMGGLFSMTMMYFLKTQMQILVK